MISAINMDDNTGPPPAILSSAAGIKSLNPNSQIAIANQVQFSSTIYTIYKNRLPLKLRIYPQ
jgi:hypothetical protein